MIFFGVKFLKVIKPLKVKILFPILLINLSLLLLNYQDNAEKYYLTYSALPSQIHFFLKNRETGLGYLSIGDLKRQLKKQDKKLLYAINGGQFDIQYQPMGLYVENGIKYSKTDTSNGIGFFYQKPNGIFYITYSDSAFIDVTENCNREAAKIKNALQSGPMLVINNRVNGNLNKFSGKTNTRSGVGIMADNRVIFILSKKKVSLYEFAVYFQSMGCKDALYLEGSLSKMYYPEANWEQESGRLGVIIGIY